MIPDLDRTERLRREFVRALIEDSQVGEAMAVPLADGLVRYFQRNYPGAQLYIPKPVRLYDVPQIEADLRAGQPPKLVARKHGTTLRQLHRLIPGGLARP